MKEEELKLTLAHEFYRCSISLNNFIETLSTLQPKSKVAHRINLYNNYVDFLSHLYEFHKGIIDDKINPKIGKTHEIYNPNKDKKTHEIIDFIFCDELRKLIRNRKNRILNGYKDDLNLHINFYDKEIPKKFGEHFRYIRNRRNHSDYKRASNNYEISLIEFYQKYSVYILIMFRETQEYWKVDVENYDWKVIDEFSIKLLNL